MEHILLFPFVCFCITFIYNKFKCLEMLPGRQWSSQSLGMVRYFYCTSTLLHLRLPYIEHLHGNHPIKQSFWGTRIGRPGKHGCRAPAQLCLSPPPPPQAKKPCCGRRITRQPPCQRSRPSSRSTKPSRVTWLPIRTAWSRSLPLPRNSSRPALISLPVVAPV